MPRLIDNFQILTDRLTHSLNDLPIGLADGKTGCCICFYTIGHLQKNDQYIEIADQLLDEIYGSIRLNDPIDLKNGLLGVGLGLRYLMVHSYIEGNINKVLREIDDQLFKRLSYSRFESSIDIDTYMPLLYYLALRVGDQKKNSEDYELYTGLLVQVFNFFYSRVGKVFFEEPLFYTVEYKMPLFLLVLSKVYELNVYTRRIEKILDELSFYVLTRIPRLHSHRLYLIWGIHKIVKATGFKEWKEHLDLLNRELNVSCMLQNEFCKKNIFFWDGLTSIYYWIKDIDHLWEDSVKTSWKSQIESQIESSQMWDLLLTDPVYFESYKGLYAGFPGTILTLYGKNGK